MKSDSNEHLLSETGLTDQPYVYIKHPDERHGFHLFGSRTTETLICVILFFSLCANVILTAAISINQRAFSLAKTPTRTVFANLEYDAIQIARTADNPYTIERSDLRNASRDENWDSINVDRTVVVIDHKEARRLGLPKSSNYVWDDTKGMYIINVYHQLHCLKKLYRRITEDEKDLPRSSSSEHLVHCIDALRQDVVCIADDNLRWNDGTSLKADGEGQIRQCKDFSKLEEWALAPERNSCFRRELVEDNLDYYQHFRQCPPDSPFFDKMRQHFGYDDDWQIDYNLTGPTFP